MHNDLEMGGSNTDGRRPRERSARRPHGFQATPTRTLTGGGRPGTTLGRAVTTRTEARRPSDLPR
jgi:hypothetical protein